MSPRKTQRQRLEELTEKALANLEADAAQGKVPTAAELNGVRRLLEAAEAERRQAEELERANAITRGE